jgi:phage gpG-like protein
MSGFSASAGGLDGVLEQLQRMGTEARQRLYDAVEGQALALQSDVVTDKLSGQVLKQGTGRLRNSIHYEMTSAGDDVVATVGTDVVYAAIHEYGGEIVPKVAKSLYFVIGGVGIHAKRVTMPERSFLRSALSDRETEIRAALAAAVAGPA